jgi:beta-carotene 3-hydroxylase
MEHQVLHGDIPVWVGVLVALLVVLAMEVVAILSHKYVNDWFGVMGAVPSILLIFGGSLLGWGDLFTWIGIGIAGYGAIYFGFHDVIVHRRIETGYVPRSAYMKRIVQAHRLHHVVESKEGTVSFGFLWAPPIEELKRQIEANRRAGKAVVRAGPVGRNLSGAA